jgi:hypothetical protein
MSFADTRRAFEARLSANWSTTPIKYEGVPFAETASAYIALNILDGEANQVSLGNAPRHRHAGVCIIQIFTPEDTGTQTPRAYADTLAALFRAQQFSAGSSGLITCRSPSLRPLGVRGGWMTHNLVIPFHRDLTY